MHSWESSLTQLEVSKRSKDTTSIIKPYIYNSQSYTCGQRGIICPIKGRKLSSCAGYHHTLISVQGWRCGCNQCKSLYNYSLRDISWIHDKAVVAPTLYYFQSYIIEGFSCDLDVSGRNDGASPSCYKHIWDNVNTQAISASCIYIRNVVLSAREENHNKNNKKHTWKKICGLKAW